MKIADIEQQLIQAGCKSVHIERFWRNWYSGKPLNRSKVRLPAATEAILPQMEEYLANQLTAQEKAESETGTRWVLKASDGQLNVFFFRERAFVFLRKSDAQSGVSFV